MLYDTYLSLTLHNLIDYNKFQHIPLRRTGQVSGWFGTRQEFLGHRLARMQEFMFQVSLIVRLHKMIRTQAEGLEVLGKGFTTLYYLPPLLGQGLIFRKFEELHTNCIAVTFPCAVSA